MKTKTTTTTKTKRKPFDALTAKFASAQEQSDNRKLSHTKNVSTTHVSQGSCSRKCPFFMECYANDGFLGMYTTSRLNKAALTQGIRDARRFARAEAQAIDTLSGKRLMRLHIVGDCKTDDAAAIIARACERYVERWRHALSLPVGGMLHALFTRKRVWAYTHSWEDVDRSSWGKHVSILASCETASQVRQAHAKGYATAIVVGKFESTKTYLTNDGVKIIPCPAQTSEHLPEDERVTCEQCRLCLDDSRLRSQCLTIGFEAHSKSAGAIRKTLMSLNTVNA